MAVNRHSRKYQLLWAIFIGGLAGLVAVGFQLALRFIEHERGIFAEWLKAQGDGWSATYILLAVALVSLTSWGTRFLCPEAAGSGIPHLKGVLMNVRVLRGIRLLLVKFVGGLLAIGSGLSLGREGPTVQMGGAVGQIVSSVMGPTFHGTALMIAVGAGAGLSAAFNAPLAGFLFVMEELHFEFAPLPYISALAASITGDMVSRLVSGQLPSLLVFAHSTPSLHMLPLFALLGLLSGFLAIVFKKALIGGIRWIDHHQPAATWGMPCLAGLLGGLAVLFLPEIAGSGHAGTENLLNGNLGSNRGAWMMFALLAGKFGLTLISYLAKVPGGIFAPMLLMGGLLGYGLGLFLSPLVPVSEAPPELFAVIGMASFFSGVVHAPLTGIALILEMTGNFKLLFPMMIATLIAFGISEWWGESPVYEALLNEDLRRVGPPPALFRHPTGIHVSIDEASVICGQAVQQVGLPDGALIICINRLGQKFIPSGKTVLQAGDGIEVMISGEISPCSQEIRDLLQARG